MALNDFEEANELSDPYARLCRGFHGVVYGCTDFGGAAHYGGVYSLSRPGVAGGTWAETILSEFGNLRQPYGYRGSAIRQQSGQVLDLGGLITEPSTRASPPVAGQTGGARITLHAFTKANPASSGPEGALLRQGGDYFGADSAGGAGYGTIFDFKP